MNKCATLKFGSNLYGTNTPESDLDLKTIFIPSFRKWIGGSPESTYKVKYFPDGKLAGPNDVMGAGCVEETFISITDFFKHLASGEVQAVEMFFAIIAGKFEFVDGEFFALCQQFKREYLAQVPIKNMVGFAKKSTLDYVGRKSSLDAVTAAIDLLTNHGLKASNLTKARMDTVVENKTFMQALRDANIPNISFGTLNLTKGSEETIESFKVASSTFGATTSVNNVISGLLALEKKYGARVRTVDSSVEWKSMMHAIRCFQQAEEFVSSGTITFPRPNAEFLKSVRRGEITQEDASVLLESLNAKFINHPVMPPADISQFLMGPVYEYVFDLTLNPI